MKYVVPRYFKVMYEIAFSQISFNSIKPSEAKDNV